ncbi:hypothetical protein MOBT1_003051 [Malassezia obtusa]|uniref:TATA-binding protein interacting (TIP20) domain-containing protein n=1 Tax=Malassezia obtusa TaxID=76774 RepID=A0AAF0E2D8_9BASI|nr:hypothetical protein MOBT1_003051 [Malassezia obtusa]
MALHATVYNRPELVQEHLNSLLPKLYQTTVVREDLKRKVAMGPFTVITDDGLDLRKNAFETLFTLLETCFGEMHVADVVRCGVQALHDDDSVKLLGCLMLVRLTDLAAQQVTPFLNEISAPLRTILTRKIRDNATKQEVEKANELTYAAVRVLAHLTAACEISAYPDFCELLAQTQQSPHAALLTKLSSSTIHDDMTGAPFEIAGPTSPFAVNLDQRYLLLPEFTLESGECLTNAPIAFQTWGKLNAEGTNAVLVCHAISGNALATVWWDSLVGPGRVIDTNKFFVHVLDYLGIQQLVLVIGGSMGGMLSLEWPILGYRMV